MASPKIKFKRSAVAGKRPTLNNLELGEIALNTFDGKLFSIQDTGGVGIATTVYTINPWNEDFGGGTIRYPGDVRVTGNIDAKNLDGTNIFVTGVTTSIGGFILRNPNDDNYANNTTPPDYSDNTKPPSMDSNPISAGIFADGSATFSGIVTAQGGFKGDLTGNVTGDITGSAANAGTVGGVTSSFLLDYTNFTNTPTVPTNNNQLTNGAGYITSSGSITGNAATATYAVNAGFSTNAGYAHTAGISTTSAFATNSSYSHVAGIATYATTSGVATNAQGLTGTPNISVNNLIAQQCDVNGITTFHSKVQIIDNRRLHIGGAEGTNGDLQIYHDTSNSYINDSGTGSLIIDSSQVNLQHSSSTKLQTQSYGISVNGICSATSITADTATFTGNVTIGGTLTYEDVNNIDSVGIITANHGVRIKGGGLSIVGVTTGLNATGISTLGIVTGATSVQATKFYGDGSSLTGINAGAGGTENVRSNTITAGIITATSEFYPPTLTTAQRDAISFNNGAMIFNTDEQKVQVYIINSWKTLAFELDPYTVVGL